MEDIERTQSNFILISYFILVFCAHFTWFLMNFALGFFTAASCQIYFDGRRHRRLNEEEQQHNLVHRQGFLDSLRHKVEDMGMIEPDSVCCICYNNYMPND
mmetsp:Transcript_13243/g.16819  ORF Transcript_13243/g.16819 Transcript_13243/m.16819 type:complete len:101 (-) Transcript_13243:175-477(-)